MNKDYINNGKEVIVTDTIGNTKVLPNYSNIEEILQEENIIESIENEMNKLGVLLESNKPKESHLKEGIIYGILFTLIPLLYALIMNICGINPVIFNTIFGSMSSPIYISILTGIVSILTNSFLAYKDYKERKKCKNRAIAIKETIDYLYKELILKIL